MHHMCIIQIVLQHSFYEMTQIVLLVIIFPILCSDHCEKGPLFVPDEPDGPPGKCAPDVCLQQYCCILTTQRRAPATTSHAVTLL